VRCVLDVELSEPVVDIVRRFVTQLHQLLDLLRLVNNALARRLVGRHSDSTRINVMDVTVLRTSVAILSVTASL